MSAFVATLGGALSWNSGIDRMVNIAVACCVEREIDPPPGSSEWRWLGCISPYSEGQAGKED
jgi:hypothetical protein